MYLLNNPGERVHLECRTLILHIANEQILCYNCHWRLSTVVARWHIDMRMAHKAQLNA